jgi:hypothetical protein
MTAFASDTTDVLLANLVRTVILLVGFVLASMCVKFAWLAMRGNEAYRGWGLLSYGALVITPAISGLYRYDLPINWVATSTYALGLFAGVMALRTAYTIAPEWTRLRRARERVTEERQIAARRKNEDVVRADDRESQTEERKDSRAMYDVGHVDESVATHDGMVESREVQDEKREQSQESQDEERAATRRAEDDR